MKPSFPLARVGSALSVTVRDHVLGPANAPVTLVEYGDYQCPYCAAAHAVLKDVQAQMGPRLCFVFRHFPLASIHPFAAHAAEAAEAAGAEGKFWEMHDLLFENQYDLQGEALLSYAAELGLNVRRFAEDLANGTHAARVREDFFKGIRSGVNGTPSLFINGQRYDGEHTFDALLSALTKKLPHGVHNGRAAEAV